MYSDTTDDTVQPTPDLNRALAEAMSENFPEVAPAPEVVTATAPDPSVVLNWRAKSIAGRSRMQTVVGIEYTPDQLTIVEVRRGRNPSILASRTVRFEEPPDSAKLAQLLKEFSPVLRNCVQLTLTSPRAVVRQFRIPPVPKHRRRAVAVWEAQKLIPFSLKDSESVFGFTFAPSPRKGWQVTLAAVPREDAGPVMEAIRSLQWTLEGVSIAGTQWIGTGQRPKGEETAKSVAAVLWSPARASFVVFHDRELKFHYDLGPMSLPPSPNGEAPSPVALQKWIKTMGKGIGEAFEFFSGAQPDLRIERIDLYGMPESAAPLITDWQERFATPVSISNPIRSLTTDLPDDVAEWLATRAATLTTAVIAAVGMPTVDMTPAAIVKTRSRRKGERVTRAILLASVLTATVWTGLLWLQQSIASRSATRAQAQLEDLKRSPVHGQLQQASLQLQQVGALTKAASAPGLRWTPYFKAIIGTFPRETRLISLLSEPVTGTPSGRSAYPMLRLDGKILPMTRSHALVYAEWFERIENITGQGTVDLIANRTNDWKGQRTSIFSIEIGPQSPAKEQRP